VRRAGDGQIRQPRTQFGGFKDSYDDMNFTAPYLGTVKARTLIVHGDPSWCRHRRGRRCRQARA
jgi:hypothetical protein